ncbi:sugar ABC transporter substrate-binding protein [Flexivirga oryzae]|uniref:Ribose transport system substrate-binding protein n=1 Tax=Flexivirga oryzae TaxID=1794944 RepID=A0A839NBA7_9MICO|nr:substrate-binding domain-containing protein [Flexivirga oryzae]MBB2891882.1 ribose transport system substrate-binding protein [Flexivirga oryzae]
MQTQPVISRTRRAAMAGAMLAVSALALSACSATSNSAGAKQSSGATNSSAKRALATAYKGVTGTPPTTSATPKKGVSLWVVSCGQSVPSCSTPVAAAKQAATKVGWTVHVCDGQLNPNGWGNCIRQATSAKAKVVIPVGIDCASVQAPMEAADKAGVTLIGGGGADCTATGGKKTLATERLQLPNTTIEQYWNLNGKLQADWIIGKTNGKAKVVMLNFTDPVWGPWITAGFKKELAKCSGCSIVKTLDISNADASGGQLAQKFSTALLQATSANSVMVPVGGWMQAGLTQAIESSNKVSKLVVSSGFGDASTMDIVRSKKFTFGALGYASEWGAYGSIDEAIRVLDDKKPVIEGDGFQMVDATHNLPATGDYTGGKVDFKADYLKLWGVS